MNSVFPNFVILIISSALCYSGTISFDNAKFITPDNWFTSTWANDPVWANDSTSRFDFIVGSGYPIHPGDSNPTPDISIFQDGSFQSANDFANVITQIDSDMYQNLSYFNDRQLEESAFHPYNQYTLIPTAAFINSQGSIERTYSFVLTHHTPYGMSNVEEQGNFGIIVDKNSIIYYKEFIQDPSFYSLSAEESTALFSVSDSYSTTNPLSTISKPTDSDNDGIPDAIETYLGNDPNDDLDAQASLDGIQNKYSLEEIKDLRADSQMIEVTNGQAKLDLKIESSKNLGWWTVDGNTFYDIPTYSVDHVHFSIPSNELGSWTIEGNLCTIITDKFFTSADGTEAFIPLSSGELASWTITGNLSTDSNDAGVNVPASELGSWTIEGNLCTIRTDNFVNKNGVPFLNLSTPANVIPSWTLEDNTFIVNQNEAYLNLKLPISSLGWWTVDGTTFKVSPHKSIVSDDGQNFILEIPRTALGWWTVDGADFTVSEDPISIRVGGNAVIPLKLSTYEPDYNELNDLYNSTEVNTKFYRFKMNGSDFDGNDITLSVGDTEYDETAIKAALAEQYGVPVDSISLSINPG